MAMDLLRFLTVQETQSLMDTAATDEDRAMGALLGVVSTLELTDQELAVAMI